MRRTIVNATTRSFQGLVNGGKNKMKYRQMSAVDTAMFAQNVATQLGGASLSAIKPAVRANLLAAIGTRPATLVAASAEVLVQRDESIAATSIRDALKLRLDHVLSKVVGSLRAADAPREQFEKCGFTYPFGPRPRLVPNAPTNLSVSGLSNALITGRFTGNNTPGTVQYEIWRRQSADAPWMLLTVTGKQSFTDSPVKPGQHHEYKVRTKAATAVSAFSGIAVVYGTI
jgi:hypothetical protein